MESDWYGAAQQGSDPVELTGGEPATLEVSIDPAAHGEQGLGQNARGVVLETDNGDRFEFELNINVVR